MYDTDQIALDGLNIILGLLLRRLCIRISALLYRSRLVRRLPLSRLWVVLLSLVLLVGILSLRRPKLTVHLWWRRGVLEASRWQTLMLQGGRLRFDKCIFDRSYHLRREDRALVHGPGHGFLPSFEHAFHSSAHIAVHESVGFHIRAIETATKVDSIGRSNILHYRVQNVESR
jgi:hypothetical protein